MSFGAMRITLVTDAWLPQVNGVTTTLNTVRSEIEGLGHSVEVVHPGLFRTVPCPRYPQIRLAVRPGRKLRRLVLASRPHAIHIATEGPLGLAARRLCRRRGWPYTTSFHTKFQEYVRVYFGVPAHLTFRLLNWFHGPAERTLAPSASVAEELEQHGFTGVVRWTRGVDTQLFRPRGDAFYELERPIFVSVGRVAAEKNIEAFLRADLRGSKVVVGDGPARAELERRHPDVHWAGFKFGEELARHYAGGDVFVFPSRTDTFGVVMLEANACGLPVAAYPVPGPLDVVERGVSGVLDDDLERACLAALKLDRAACRRYAQRFSWARCASILVDSLAPFNAFD